MNSQAEPVNSQAGKLATQNQRGNTVRSRFDSRTGGSCGDLPLKHQEEYSTCGTPPGNELHRGFRSAYRELLARNWA